MYVMSSLPPAQQSLAGGIFNTVNRLCAAIGLGISTSIYNAESAGTAALQTAVRPYKMLFWFTVAAAAAGLVFVPFLTIGTQGHTSRPTSVVSLDRKAADPAAGGDENFDRKAPVRTEEVSVPPNDYREKGEQVMVENRV
jgi:hypothetical protein